MLMVAALCECGKQALLHNVMELQISRNFFAPIMCIWGNSIFPLQRVYSLCGYIEVTDGIQCMCSAWD